MFDARKQMVPDNGIEERAFSKLPRQFERAAGPKSRGQIPPLTEK